MSSIMMLDHLGESKAARRIESALHGLYRERKSLTRDVGGTATIAEFTEALIGALK
jgi:isocitrate dehydrogenase (NAD+)